MIENSQLFHDKKNTSGTPSCQHSITMVKAYRLLVEIHHRNVTEIPNYSTICVSRSISTTILIGQLQYNRFSLPCRGIVLIYYNF